MTPSIQHKTRLSTITLSFKYHYVECHYAECRILFIVMPNAIMLNVIMLRVVAPLVGTLGKPFQHSLMFVSKAGAYLTPFRVGSWLYPQKLD